MEIRKIGVGVVVAGNENSKAETIRILASAVIKGDKGDLISDMVGNGMGYNADAIANSPGYQEAVEVLALRLVDIVKKNLDTIADLTEQVEELTEQVDYLTEKVDDLTEQVEDLTEDEDERVCARCGEVIDEDNPDWDYVNGDVVCYECMTASEYIEINE